MRKEATAVWCRSQGKARRGSIAALGAAALTLAVPVTRASGQPAMTVLFNGKILTLDSRSTIAEAMSIRGDKIAVTGTSADVLRQTAPHARRIDLGGRTVIPGLIDSHIHAIRAGLRYSTEVSWIGATSIAEAMQRLSIAAVSIKPGGWLVVGGGWTPAQFEERRRPTEAEVVAAAPGLSIYVQLFYRSVLLSPEARAGLGIAYDALSAPDSPLTRDAGEHNSGWLNGNTVAITGLYEKLPRPSPVASADGTQRFFRALNRLGVTGVIDPGGHNLAPEEYATLLHLWRERRLSVRVAYSISAPRPGIELADFETLTRFLPMGVGDDMLRFNGIGERVTWGMYNNDEPSQTQKEDLYRVARWAADRGLSLTAHWNNDRSVHHLLDVFERVDRETPIRDLRWSVAHLHDASDVSLARLKAIGAGWLLQNGLHFAAAGAIASRGAAITRSPPIQTALRMGLRIGAGTDAHRVMSYNPFVSLRWMTDGRTVDGLPTRGRTELVSREEALRLYTAGSAWFAFDEARRGTLEPGKLADLAVLDRDYMTIPAEQLPRLQSMLTLLGGRAVHASGPFESLLGSSPE
jgi:predicted amidohydrolase YtcJ